MSPEKLSAALTVRCGGLSTGEVAFAFGCSRPKAWKTLRALELQGLLIGEARDRHGDEVLRKDDGRPATVGGEIRWYAPMAGRNESESDASRAVAAAICAALAGSPAVTATRAKAAKPTAPRLIYAQTGALVTGKVLTVRESDGAATRSMTRAGALALALAATTRGTTVFVKRGRTFYRVAVSS